MVRSVYNRTFTEKFGYFCISYFSFASYFARSLYSQLTPDNRNFFLIDSKFGCIGLHAQAFRSLLERFE